ncbi:alpha/beta hydrolase [Gymnodinialimonas sp. 2305UL16-5]|uniref:serine aminopeptidase domain-containing protein n=1 Tax=Gymnodinialimonas mytili TaxID=3126503 RepID=UPI0030B5B970
MDQSMITFRKLRPTPVTVCFFLAAACSNAPDVPETPIEEQARWAVCDWSTGTGDREAECAFVTVPLEHGASLSERYRLLVKRRGASAPLQAQVWLVSGGPGDAATANMERLSGGIHQDRPDIALYAVDHRGTGGSERLDCPGLAGSATSIQTGVAEVEACGAELHARLGDRLSHVTLTASAHDLAALITANREPGVPVFVYGGSYGTIVIQRYLELYPNQPDGVIMEALATGRFLDGYDASFERTGRNLLRRCAVDPACADRFDGDPWDIAQRAVASLDNGSCTALGASSADARLLFGSMLFSAPVRDLIPAAVLRLNRCRPEDVSALNTLAGRLTELAVSDDGSSDVLGAHVFLSETQPPRDRSYTLLQDLAGYTMATGLEAHISRIEAWPRTQGQGVPLTPPPYDGPLLMLQGALDAPTPLSRANLLRDTYRGPSQVWAEFPDGSHQLTGATPMLNGDDCARRIRIQFLDNPFTPPDLGCIAQVMPPAWEGSDALNLFLFGNANAWGEN